MESYKKNDLITELEISIRSKNALKSKDINTVEDLLNYTEKEIYNIRNLGKKSIYEILNIFSFFKKNHSFYWEKKFFTKDQNKYIDYDIDELELSARSKNALKKENIILLSQILRLNEEDIRKIRHVGEKSKLEILKFKDEVILKKNGNTIECSEEFIKYIGDLEREYNGVLFFTEEIVKKIYLIFSEEEKKSNFSKKDKKIFSRILSIESIRENFKNNILQNIKLYEYGCSIDTIIDRSILKINELRDDLLIELLEEKKIEIIEGNNYIINKPSIKIVLENHLKNKKINETQYAVLCGRLKGKTLSELGNALGKTRERIRQIEVKSIDKIKNNLVREDKYRYLYENYDISEEDFNIAFKEDIETYNYLRLKFKKKVSTQLENVLNDNKIPLKMKISIEKAIYKRYFLLNGERVLKNRGSLIKYLCKTYASENSLEIKELKSLYLLTIEELKEEENEKLNTIDRGSENSIAYSKYFLWNNGHKFRYYDIEKNDYSEFFRQIDLMQYKNLEISTLKIFRLYPDLMNEYDIRDEYELHNLLKKICCSDDFPTLKFGRMPMIEFGEIDRNIQILDLLKKLSPIKKIDFANQYELEYGIKAATLLGTVMKNYNNYSIDKIYDIAPEVLEKDEIELLKRNLYKDFYTVVEFEKIFRSILLSKELKYINGFNLNLLGYKLYSSYIISSKFESSREFFNNILLKDGILDTEKLDESYKYIISYTQELQKNRDNFELLEFSSKKYINILKLKKFGVTKKKIEEFIEKVIEFIPDNRIFTYTYLQNLGFYHDFEDLGFEEYFYSSILSRKKDMFSSLKKYGSILLRKGKHSVSLLEIIEILILSKEDLKIDIHDIIEILEREYGLKINKNQILNQTRESRIYYSQVTEILYGDYEIYYEEIGL